MAEINMNALMTEVVNSNPGYDGLKKKAIYVPHEDTVYHGFTWSDEDRRVMAINRQWHRDNKKMPDNDVRASIHYAMSLPPTLAMWLYEQPQWAFGDASERKKFVDNLVATEPIWKCCQRW